MKGYNIIVINVGFDPRYIPSIKQSKKRKLRAWDDQNYFDTISIDYLKKDQRFTSKCAKYFKKRKHKKH